MKTVIAIDPGNEKTGIALVREDDSLIEKRIVPTETLAYEVEKIFLLHNNRTADTIDAIVCGNGTNHKKLYPLVQQVAIRLGVKTFLIKEAYTTEEGRKRYWQYEPPKGIRRFVPISFQSPPRPVDDYTAWIIGERYFRGEIDDQKK